MKNIHQRRSGFTLIEVMISMTLLLFILGIATNSFRKQGSVIAAQAGRLEAQQTVQFTLSELDRELRLAGVGVADMQPILVQADSMSLTFNADLVSTVLDDPGTVYIDPDADPLFTNVFHSTNKLQLPTSNPSRLYPDSTYMKAIGAPSGAETISFWLSKDSTSSLTNEYVLFRRVNHGPSRVVATGIIRNPTDTIFQYYKADSVGALTAIPKTQLPLYHNAVIHGSKADTGQYARIDSVKTLRIRLSVVFKDRSGPVYRRLDHTIRLMNAGLIRRSTCGEIPTNVATPVATASLDVDGAPFVTITFVKSGDEDSGEKDVERYALFKRLTGTPGTMDEPFASIPAGSNTYSFVDTDVKSGEQWDYGVAVQDCTPATSSVVSALSVTIP